MGHTVRSAKYISLTTFKRNGDAVSTPVWIAPALSGEPFRPGELCFVSELDTWKVKRIRRNPRVEVRECDIRGTVAPDAQVYAGEARLLTSPEDVAAVKRAIGNKYGWWYHVFAAVERRIAAVYSGYATRVGIAILLDADRQASGADDAKVAESQS